MSRKYNANLAKPFSLLADRVLVMGEALELAVDMLLIPEPDLRPRVPLGGSVLALEDIKYENINMHCVAYRIAEL